MPQFAGFFAAAAVTLGTNARVVAIWPASHSGLNKSLPVFVLFMIVAGIKNNLNTVVYVKISLARLSWSLEIQT